MSLHPIRLITRKSPLALWQAEHVAALLRAAHPGLEVQLIGITTAGDRFLSGTLNAIGGKGLFVKELEEAMLAGEADIAVHSMKDVTVDLPAGLALATLLPRADPRDCWLSPAYHTLAELPQGARVGTASLRRRCQLLALRPDLDLVDLRGNVGTRLGRLERGDYAAIVLAAAGLDRLGLADHPALRERFSPEQMLPAVGQGVIGIECRDDPALRALLTPLHHADTALCVSAERALNRRLGGACHVPVAGYATLSPTGELRLRGRVGTPDGRELLAAEAAAPASAAEALGIAVAEALIGQGADRILASLAQVPPG
jgi:hydroxymethylbilane synthase